MHRLLWLSLLALALAAFVFGCPRKPAAPPVTTTPPVTIQNQNQVTPPATDTTIPPATTPDGTTPPATDGTTPPATDATTPPATPGTDQTPPATEQKPYAAPPGATLVMLETTKGNILLELHKDWSPLGVAHFLELVNAKFYDGAPWFRVIDGFVAQCGVAATPALNAAWGEKTIQDEPVLQGNQPGYVAFGKSGAPNSRSTHFFINLVDNTQALDGQGFSCFAKVVEGMDVALKLYKAEYQDQQGLAAPGGLDAFKSMYPQADYIKKAYIKK